MSTVDRLLELIKIMEKCNSYYVDMGLNSLQETIENDMSDVNRCINVLKKYSNVVEMYDKQCE